MNWLKIRDFVHKRTLFCGAAVVDEGRLRVFPIGSLRIGRDGSATYFELFARPVPEGAEIAFLAVDASLWFWLKSLIRGQFDRPPALRLYGTTGRRRPCSEKEKQGWYRRVGLLLRTRGGKALWSKPGPIREVQFDQVEAVNLGSTTSRLRDWVRGC
jgi:hypothetical protein